MDWVKRKGEKPAEARELIPEDLGPIMAELMKQSDRGAAIIAASLLEQILAEAITRRLRPFLSGQRKAFFGRMAPLSTFSAKIELGFLVGLYTEAAYKNFGMIREVRNKFAHTFDALSFDHPDIVKLVNKDDRPRLFRNGAPGSRGEFMGAFGVLGALLLAMQVHDVRLPTVAETHGPVLRQIGAALNQGLQSKEKPPRGSHPESSGQKP